VKVLRSRPMPVAVIDDLDARFGGPVTGVGLSIVHWTSGHLRREQHGTWPGGRRWIVTREIPGCVTYCGLDVAQYGMEALNNLRLGDRSHICEGCTAHLEETRRYEISAIAEITNW
jgi:hypothetical protein